MEPANTLAPVVNSHARSIDASTYHFFGRIAEMDALISLAQNPDSAREILNQANYTHLFEHPDSQLAFLAMSRATNNGDPVRESVETALETILSDGEHDAVGARCFLASIYESKPQKGTAAQSIARLRKEHEAALKPQNQDFPLNDIGAGRRFAAMHGDKLRFCPVRHAWLIYQGGRWKPAEKGEAEASAKTVEAAVAAEARKEDNDTRRAQLFKYAASLTEHSKRQKMLKDAASEPGMTTPPEEFDALPHLFNLANGTLDLKTFQLHPHNAADLLMHQSPVKYDPQSECPTWQRCLTRWIPDATVRDFLQEAVGVSISGEVTDEQFIVLLGDGENGKSTALRQIEALTGSYGHKTQAETLMQARDQRRGNAPAPEILALKGARFVAAGEVDSRHEINASLIKDLTGRDSITARGVFDKRPTTFLPQFTLWLVGNSKPKISDTSSGMWRRPKLVEFGQPITKEERDPHLGRKLHAELPGILNWALEGLRKVNERGYLEVPDAVNAAVEAYREEQDPLSHFFAERCVIAPNCKVKFSDLRGAWDTWCNINGEVVGSPKWLGAELTRRKFAEQLSGGRWRLGIALKSPENW